MAVRYLVINLLMFKVLFHPFTEDSTRQLRLIIILDRSLNAKDAFSLYLLSQCQRCLIDTSVFLSPFGNEKEIKAFVMPLVATFVKLQVKCLITTGVISMSQFYLHESCSVFWLAVSSTLSDRKSVV